MPIMSQTLWNFTRNFLFNHQDNIILSILHIRALRLGGGGEGHALSHSSHEAELRGTSGLSVILS